MRQIAFPLVPVGYILVGLTVCESGIGLCNCVIISYPFRSKKLQLHAQRRYMDVESDEGEMGKLNECYCLLHVSSHSPSLH